MLRFRSGAVGTIASSTAVFPGFPQRLEVSGTSGTVVIEDGAIVCRGLASDSPGRACADVRLPRPAGRAG